MPNFDLNNTLDFAKVTNSSAAGILQTFTGRGDSAWDIQEGAYISPDGESILFHVFKSAVNYNAAVSQVTDSGGRRKTKNLFPYLDGQLTEDIGRTPYTFDIDILIHGDNYFAAFTKLLKALNDPRPGTLIHPIMGRITCVMTSNQILHQSDKRKAVALRLVLEEHSFAGIDIRKQKDPTAPGALARLVEAFKKIDAVLAKVQGAVFLVRSVRLQIENSIRDFKNAYAKIAGNMNAVFNPGDSSIPGLLPTNQNGVQLQSGEIATSSNSIVASVSDPFLSVPVDTISANTSIALATEQIYKDIQKNRDDAATLIETLETSGDGQGSHEFYSEILGLKEAVVQMQDAFDKGKQSSQVKIIEYVTPHDMTIREVAFANGLSPDQGNEIVLLNPEIECANYLEKGSTVKVAVT